MKQGGVTANQTGKKLEQFIENSLLDEKYKFIDKTKFILSMTNNLNINIPIKTFTTQFNIGKGIYGTPIRCDFILYNSEKHPNGLVIESKWQQGKGSVDEKFPYLEQNIKKKYKYNTIIILDGNGYKPGANKWLRSQINNNLIGVYNMMEFNTYINNGGL